MPVLMRLFLKEERIGRARKKLKNIFKNHRSVFEIYFFLFLGIFFAFLILQLTTIYNQDFFANAFEFQSNWVIDNQESFGIIQEDIMSVIISSFIVDFLILLVRNIKLNLATIVKWNPFYSMVVFLLIDNQA